MSTTVLPPAAFGYYGNTTTQCRARIASLSIDDIEGATATPDVFLLNIGVNDPVGGISQSTTQLNIEGMILAAKFGAYGDRITPDSAFVAGQANLPASARDGERRVVLSDTSTTGGAAAVFSWQKARIAGSASGPTVWECRRGGGGGELNWGRVANAATAPTHCQRIVVLAAPYKNFSTNGGDTTAAGASARRDTTSTPEPYYATVRAAQQAAVTAQNVAVSGKPSVVYSDVYNLQRTMIVGGTFPASGSPVRSVTYAAGDVPDFSGGATYDATKDWHHKANDQHHGTFGHWTVALSAFFSIINAGWRDDLAAIDTVNVKALGDSQTDYNGGFTRARSTWPPVLGDMLRAELVA